ncbi:MAG: hypothetical protein E6I48_02035 [Chloroflexi bacterium]|nr:MAG: hypothetical protein E6I48_02035 [Chloroflexota bacterium]
MVQSGSFCHGRARAPASPAWRRRRARRPPGGPRAPRRRRPRQRRPRPRRPPRRAPAARRRAPART